MKNSFIFLFVLSLVHFSFGSKNLKINEGSSLHGSYVSQELNDSYQFNQIITQYNLVFHVFTHAKSGHLLIDNEWVSGLELVDFLKEKSKGYNSINIYGCEFAKGKEGIEAIRFLEKSLNKKISASNDITGIDGDWDLEIGNKQSFSVNYNHNLQCTGVVGGMGDSDDFDGDTICNQNDLDDDNDGVLDTDESECTNVTDDSNQNMDWTGMGLTGWNTNLGAGFGTKNIVPGLDFSITELTGDHMSVLSSLLVMGVDPTDKNNARLGQLDTVTYKLEFTAPVSDLTLNFSGFTQGGTVYEYVQFEHPVSGVVTYLGGPNVPLWDNLNYTIKPNAETNSDYGFSFTFDSPVQSVTFSMISFGEMGAARGTNLGRVNYNPIIGEFCNDIDTDGDGIFNRFDLDSDEDGCSDALEAGATLSTSSNYQFTGTDANSDGLVDELDTDSNGDTDYSSNYDIYALDDSVKRCLTSVNACTAEEVRAGSRYWTLGFGSTIMDFGINGNSVPTVSQVATQINAETASTITDTSGNLLGYFGTRKLLDGNGVEIDTSVNLGGGASTTQSSAILGFSSTRTQAILLANSAQTNVSGTIRWTIFDFDTNTLVDQGDISGSNEMMLPILSATPDLIWVLTKDTGNAIKAIEFGPSGPTGKVVSSATSVSPISYFGEMTANANGTKIAFYTGGQGDKDIMIMDFDPSTGKAIEKIVFDASSVMTDQVAYGLELSPSGTYIYATDYPYESELHRFDISSEDETTILASAIDLDGLSEKIFGIEIGPEGRLWGIGRNGTAVYLDNPDSPTLTESDFQSIDISAGDSDSMARTAVGCPVRLVDPIPVCTDSTNTAYNCDYDGDGILNVDDLDDDNDGLLDTEECIFENEEDSWFWNVLPIDLGLVGGTSIANSLNAIGDVSSTFGLPTGSVIVEVIDANMDETSFAVGNSGQNRLKVKVSGSVPMRIGVAHSTNYDDDIIRKGFIANTKESYEFYFPISNSDLNVVNVGNDYYVDKLATGVITQPSRWESTQAENYVEFYSTELGTDFNFDNRVSLSLARYCPDTDNDGIINSLDLDSDGDGCPDAIEGDGNFSLTDLIEDLGLNGGNNSNGNYSSYTGSVTDLVQSNLGKDSNSDGTVDVLKDDEVTINEFQNNNSSTNETIISDNCACDSTFSGDIDTDGDGVLNNCDLDDDNDGLLDEDEQVLSFLQWPSDPSEDGKHGPVDVVNGGEITDTANFVLDATDLGSDSRIDLDWNVVEGLHNVPGLNKISDGSVYGGSIAFANTTGVTNTITLGKSYEKIYFISNYLSGRDRTTYDFSSTPGLTKISIIGRADAVSNLQLDGKVISYTTSPDTEEEGISLLFEGDLSTIEWVATTSDWIDSNVFTIIGSNPDSDLDGLPNHLDLDSDGDGCPDALEGDGGYVFSDLVEDTNIDGGNNSDGTISNYVGDITDAVQLNLGKDSNSDGTVDILADDEVTINESQNDVSSKEKHILSDACLCLGSLTGVLDTDGDGVGDACDLDDDNDGILDTDEGLDCNAVLDYTNLDGSFNQLISDPKTGKIVRVTTAGSVTDGNDLGDFRLKKGGDEEITFNFSESLMVSVAYEINMTGAFDTSNSQGPDYWRITSENDIDLYDPNSDLNILVNSNGVIEMQAIGAAGSSREQWSLSTNTSSLTFELLGGNPASPIHFGLGCKVLDTDGDGIPNHKDLDSDGDGCPDALEGDGGYVLSDLVEDTNIDGGNNNDGTVSSYLGEITDAIQLNLGKDSNSDGTLDILGDDETTINEFQNDVSSASSVKSDACNCDTSFPGVIDTDGDGVGDLCDLDDDNDGILDTDEDAAIVNEIKEENYTTACSQNTVSYSTTNGVADVDPSLGFTFREAGASTETGDVYTFDFTDPVDLVGVFIDHLMFDTVVGGFTVTYDDNSTSTNLDFDLSSNPYNISVLASDNLVKTNFGVNNIPAVQDRGGTGFDTSSQAFGTLDFLGLNPNKKVKSLRFEILAETARTIASKAIILPILQCDMDTDKDGIPNKLDLDSDGDGCPDALEGDGNYVLSDLVEDTNIDGGNNSDGTISNYVGDINDAVQLNLGKDSNSDGTLDILEDDEATINEYQNDLTSKDKTKLSDVCLCTPSFPNVIDTDGDGVGDYCDLDDDNDGLLDTDEQNCVYSVDGLTTVSTLIRDTELNIGNGPAGHPFDGTETYFYFDATGGSSTGSITRNFSEPMTDLILGFTNIDFRRRWVTDENDNILELEMVNNQSGNVVVGYVTSDLGNSNLSGYAFWDSDTQTHSNGLSADGSVMIKGTYNSIKIHYDYNPNPSVVTTTDGGAFGLIKRDSCIIDTDLDGIPDHLDLDSDGDGCPDALEGDGGYVLSDLIEDTNIDGGNNNDGSTTASYTGTVTDAIQLNLGKDSNSDGTVDILNDDETTINESQNDVSSTDSSIKSDVCNCDTSFPGVIDTDGDGIGDICDLDDDNDGILDDEECPSVETDIPVTFWQSPYSDVFDGINVTGTATSSPIVNTSTNTVSFNAPSGGTGFRSLTFNFDDAVDFEVDIVNLGASVEYWTFDQTLNEVKSTIHPYHAISGNSVIVTTGGTNGQGGTADPSTLFFSGITSLTLSYTSSNSAHNAGFRNMKILRSGCIDTDNDGIPNNLDLDSDGDGCPDALEGDGGYVLSDLVQDTNIDGGNNNDGSLTGTYTGIYTGLVQTNLGKDSNSDGTVDMLNDDETTINEYQNDVSSTDGDVLSEACECNTSLPGVVDTDGDGIANPCDIDDDNDGILDTAEQSCKNEDPLCLDVSVWGTSSHCTGWYSENANFDYISPSQLASWGQPSHFAIDISGQTSGNTQPGANPDQVGFVQKDYATVIGATYTYSIKNSPWFTERAGGELRAYDKNSNSVLTSISIEGGSSGTVFAITFTATSGITTIQFGIETEIETDTPNWTVIPDEDIIDTETNAPYLSCDTDGDGIPNQEDLDSDGDGCPDSLETDIDKSFLTEGSLPDGLSASITSFNNGQVKLTNGVGDNGFDNDLEDVDDETATVDNSIYTAGVSLYKNNALNGTINIACGASCIMVNPVLIREVYEDNL